MKRYLILSIASVCCFIFTFAQTEIEIPARLTDRPELIIKHCGYTVSYNTARGTPNWSAWVLTKSHLSGHEPRSPQFFADPLVPIACRVQPSDYTGSGFDRGHMCPAADMTYSSASMHDCFYMSNMCPQAPALNRVSWKALESACRKWVMTEDTLYIVCGPVYQGVTKKKGKTHLVSIPNAFFKVILSLRKGHAKAIGFIYKNTSIKQSLSATTMSVDAIEKITGINFFYTLDDSIEDNIESRYNLKEWK